ncbi:hypothetical protein SL910_29520 [Klebsiella pneumoniae]
MVRTASLTNMDMCLMSRQKKFSPRQALTHAEAGADIVAPSDMMDGRIDISDRHLKRRRWYSDHGIFSEIRVKLLRSFSRSHSICHGAGQTGQKKLSDGPGKCDGSVA